MAGPAQTPTMFLKAGGANPLMLPACKKALAACGYTPEDFGSYKEVGARCGAARKETGEAKPTPGGKPPNDPEHDPTAHEAWLATCESGHIAENTRHQAKRGDNDTSFCPLYEWQNAPCMPHSGKAGWRDTQHGAVTATDVETSNEAGQGERLGVQGERAATRRAIEAALDWGMNDQPAAEQSRKKRFAAIAALNAGDPKLAASKVKTSPKDQEKAKKKFEAKRKTAADCVEGFFEYQWRKMAKNTKDKKKAEKKAADAEKARAEEALAEAEKSGNKTKIKNAKGDLRAATERQEAADADWDRVKNLRPNNTDACMGQSRGGRERTESTKNAPPPPRVKRRAKAR